MKVIEFNNEIKKYLWPCLQNLDFVQYESSFVYSNDINQFVLLRINDKYSGLCQYTDFSVCFRHNFLRDVWEKVPNNIPKERSSFPFRVKPSLLSEKWSYRFVLNPDESDRFEYGKLNSLENSLMSVAENVKNNFSKWMLQFSPQNSLRLIQQHGSNSFIEQLWTQDYERYLKSI